MFSIAIFNNKGGVGKTTLICNLASYLKIKLQKRVLVIDADPQCNASIYVTQDSDLVQVYSNTKTKTIYDIIKPLQRGSDYIDPNNIPIIANPSFGFDIILGDTRLSLAEDFLSSDWIDGQSGNPRGLKTTFLFKDLLQKLESRYDFIFFDIGPSLGAINRNVLLSCDYFIIPMSSDIFSIKAIDNISESLNKWKQLIDDGLKKYQNEFDHEPYMIGENNAGVNLKFLGYIYQQYVTKTDKDGIKRPVKAFDSIIKKMNKTLSSKLESFYTPSLSKENLLIGEIPTLNSLIPLSQIAHKPIFCLSGVDGVVGAHFSKVREYENVIDHISQNIKKNIDTYGLA
jgi:cellulose biosynthesis protein BcsQ